MQHKVVIHHTQRSLMGKYVYHHSIVSGDTLTSSIFYFLQENIHCQHFK